MSRQSIFLFYFSAFLALISIQVTHAQILPDFTPIIEKNSVAVVNISTTLKQAERPQRRQSIPNIPKDSPFYDFFRRFFDEMPEGTQPYSERTSLGSGFIISQEGYIITNNHVIADADEIIVRFNDRREFVAQIVGTDYRSDIAVLKIDAENLPVLKLGDSSKLRVGKWVLAIGSPFGFDYSVTQGIISAIGRSLPSDNYVPFIQTDVAINPGNSGGPLFNLAGEVIGVNSQIYSRNGGYMGLSFAVPINVVTNVYKQIREKGSVSRGWLGVIIQDVTRDLAESFGMDIPRGALIARVLPDSPAEKYNLAVGDIITKFNNTEVRSSSQLPPIVGDAKIGSKVPVEVIRDSKLKSIDIVLEELPEDMKLAGIETGQGEKSTSNLLNITVADPTDEQRQQLQIEDHGVLVQSLEQGPARSAGIRQGDVILLLNNEKVRNVKQFNQIVKDLPKDKSIPILIQRRGNPIFLAFKMSDN